MSRVGIALAVVGVVISVVMCAVCGATGWLMTSSGGASPTWTLELDGMGAIVVEDDRGLVVVRGFSGVELRTIDLATGATRGSVTLEPRAGSSLTQRDDPAGRHVVFLELDSAQTVTAVHTADASRGPQRIAVPPGTREDAISFQAGLVVVAVPEGAIAYDPDGREVLRIALPGARVSGGVWNESSNTLALFDESWRAFLYDRSTGAALETLETETTLRFLTDRHVIRLDGSGGIEARVRGGPPEPVMIPNARAFVAADDWIAFCGSGGLVVLHADLTPFGERIPGACADRLDRSGDRITVVPYQPEEPVRTYDVRAGTLRELGSAPIPWITRVVGGAVAPEAHSAPHAVVLRGGGVLHGFAVE